MFFSVIVPTYNPRQYLPALLRSILTNACKDEIEIIISDDCSDEPFDDVLEPFSMLNITVFKNDKHYGFPRNGRSNGAKMANGKWICFADQDDYYIDNGFDKIKNYIESNNIKNYLASDFVVHYADSEEYVVYHGTGAWTHGKFYEKTFWDKYSLDYDDVQYCEDINLSTKTGCILVTENIPMEQFHEPVYIWNKRTDSLSMGNGFSYFSKSMPDYVRSTFGVIVNTMNKHRNNKDITDKLGIKFIQTLYHLYFNFQSAELIDEKKTLHETIIVFYPYYELFKEIQNVTMNDIIAHTFTDWSPLYSDTRQSDYQQIPFVERMAFADWMHSYIE